jgi:hypothetical protein
MFHRRSFLKTLFPFLLPGQLSYALAQNAQTQSNPTKYFLGLYFEGGWDLLLGLDPRDPNLFNESNQNETSINPAYSLIPPQFSRQPIRTNLCNLGPCASSIAPYIDQMALLRGIDMSTLTHEVGRRYMITGQVPIGISARGSSLSTLACSYIGDQSPIPQLSHKVESYNTDQPAFAGALNIGAVDQLKYLLKDQLGIPSNIPPQVIDAIQDLYTQQLNYAQNLNPQSNDRSYQQKEVKQYLETRTKVRHLIHSHLADQFDFSNPSINALKQQYQLNQNPLESPYGRAALAAQSIKKGLSRVVTVSLSEGLDTHDQSWATDHPVRLFQGFDALASLISDFKNTPDPDGGTLLDHTLIYVFSEFGRTPTLNIRGGRDHHPCNSAILMGSNIKPLIFGSSSDQGMAPQKFNELGQNSDAGKALRPGDIAQTILSAISLDHPIENRIQGDKIQAILNT